MDQKYIEIGRMGHQLAAEHGWNAYVYAARLAKEAEAEGMIEEAEFWRKVSIALAPRQTNLDMAAN